ncbi:hypothetical protein MMC19_000276 [Ptychographa xylographoides]|nr:hypothetical protein [Ptychographa xylographoides]
MADFLANLWDSVFTPGPTPTLILATNAAFAALQAVLLALLIATSSIHFVILSFLSGGLWWAINWFVREIAAGAKAEEEEAKKKGDVTGARDIRSADDSGTETEEASGAVKRSEKVGGVAGGLRPDAADEMVRRRRSLGEVSGTDSEWDKVENEGDD